MSPSSYRYTCEELLRKVDTLMQAADRDRCTAQAEGRDDERYKRLRHSLTTARQALLGAKKNAESL